jgi:hypothetical protein
MTGKRKRRVRPPLVLDMDFGEAMERFAQTKMSEVQENIDRSKKKKPSGGKRKRKPSDGTSQGESVVSLRDRRMRKRNYGH